MDTFKHIAKMNPDLDTRTQLIVAYEKKTRLMMEFINKAAGLIGDYRNEQEEMLKGISDGLAARAGLRKKDFYNFMGDVLSQREETEKGVNDALKALWKGEEEIIKVLRDVLTTGKTANIEALKKERLPLLPKKESEAARLLMKLHLEQAELSIALKQLFSKGEKAGIKDLKVFIKVMDVRRKERENGLDRLFEEWDRVRLDVITKWHGVLGAYERAGTGRQ